MKVQDEASPLLSSVDYSRVHFQSPMVTQEEGAISQISSMQQSKWKVCLYNLGCVLTCGLLYLFGRWDLSWRLIMIYVKSDLSLATHLLILNESGEQELVKISQRESTIGENRGIYKFFEYRLYTYYLDENDIFQPVETQFKMMTYSDILQNFTTGVKDVIQVQEQYGKNNTQIPDKSTLRILIDEILSPFYVFQLFSIILWSIEEYYSYAVVIMITSVVSVIVTLREAKANFQKLRDMTNTETEEVVYRGQTNNQISLKDGIIMITPDIENFKKRVSSKDILPGDLIEVHDNWTAPCDCILINGSCIINEAMLTGESIPIIKSPLPKLQTIYNGQEDSKQHTLYAGTKCIEARHVLKGTIPILAIASETGFSTVKGQLVRSILFPKPTKFSFHRDSMLFVGVLGIMSLIGFSLTIKDQAEEYDEGNIEISQMIINALDLITITVPPALPTCLSIGISFALARLQKKQIYCISPNRVNVAGKITIMCFDKTGTLTSEGLDLYGVRPIGYSDKKSKLCFKELVINMSDLNDIRRCGDKDMSEQLLEIMACCHGLATVNGELIGDPLEVKMFEATGAKLDDLNGVIQIGSQEIRIFKRYDFSSTLQRMSVIVQRGGIYRAHVKGSPEKLRELCTKESIPGSFHKVLDYYSKMGFRVLACGSKNLGKEQSREQIEQGLTFMGFMVMENKLKSKTKEVIQTLQGANIRTVMVTGDNVLTAISVARQCNLVQAQQRIFLGDIDEKSGKIVWKDFEMNQNQLNGDNLSPMIDIIDDPDIEESEIKFNHSLTKTMEIIVGDSVDRKTRKKSEKMDRQESDKYYQVKQEEKQIKAENLDHLIDDDDPWKTEEPFVIAISGKAFQLLLDQVEGQNPNPKARRVFGIMLERAQIFARMKPDQKACLITHLQKVNRKALCGMCGDGANDCGALKAADVGISLSDAEASIAAPFTSKIQDISCVLKLLREGRASLVTSFQCFKYMALYSMIQFASVTLLYQVISNLNSNQFTYIDLVIIIPLAATMGQTKSYKKLTYFQPGSHLISFPVLMSVIGQTAIQITFQCVVYFRLTRQDWYVSGTDMHKDIGDIEDHFAMERGFENTTLFLYVNYQYVIQCLTFSMGKPFRRPFYTNIYFTVWLGLLMLLNTYIIMLYRIQSFIADLFNIIYEYKSEDSDKYDSVMPDNWLYFLLILMAGNLIVNLFFEKYVVPIVTRWYRAKKRSIVKRYRYPENPYLRD